LQQITEPFIEAFKQITDVLKQITGDMDTYVAAVPELGSVTFVTALQKNY
jgi:hypothetical protein